MSIERLVKRTIWVAECPHDRTEHSERTRKERYCPECKAWVAFKEVSWTGPEIDPRKR